MQLLEPYKRGDFEDQYPGIAKLLNRKEASYTKSAWRVIIENKKLLEQAIFRQDDAAIRAIMKGNQDGIQAFRKSIQETI